ncbi:Ig-like domain-containing protein [uncultured Methanobrevibacter sp.]|uniref:Ig-like domain-containing protein n=1 Tax=uncultured Methanobrevibacter sp. TaxID=253161 RepID=UPI0026160CA5|nr:Ig-like domain-containing protein [uncultured Methanobrevibacter sp.]
MCLCISSVEASDHFDGNLTDSPSEMIIGESDNNVSGEKTFNDVQTLIDSAQEGDTIQLDGIYKRNASEKQIVVNKSVTLSGNNVTLDCNGVTGIFTVSAPNVAISNINFINAWKYGKGGAIEVLNSNCSIVSCNFSNNFASEGGAIYAQEDTVMEGCIFVKNLADEKYDVNKFIVVNGILKNCIFDENYALGGVALNCIVENSYFHKSRAVKSKYVINSVFEDNFIAFKPLDGCSIINCTVVNTAIVFDISNLNVSIIGCTFKDNLDGFVCIGVENSTVTFLNCNLINNNASNCSAINLTGNNTVKLIDCLINDTSLDSGVMVEYNTRLSASNLNVVYNTGNYPIITLKDSFGNPVSDAKLSLNVGSNKVTVTTNGNGQAKITKSLVPKTYATKIAFAGNEQFLSSSLNTKIVIKKATPKLTASNKSYKVKATKKLSATLKDNKGKVLKSKKITFKLKGKTYSAKTNSKGVATVTVKITSKGTFKVAVRYAGDNYFNSIGKSIKLTVKK